MELYYIALAGSLVVNASLAYMVFTKGSSVVEVLAEFKAAVVKVKAAKDKASVDAVAYSANLPQILDLLK